VKTRRIVRKAINRQVRKSIGRRGYNYLVTIVSVTLECGHETWLPYGQRRQKSMRCYQCEEDGQGGE